MTDATELDEAAVREAAEKALGTGDWWDPHDLREALDRIADVGDDTRADAEYIWRVRPTKVLALLKALDEARAEVAELRLGADFLVKWKDAGFADRDRWQARTEVAESALAAVMALHRSDGSGGMGPFCVECARVDVDGDQRWPCATIRALATPTTTERSEG